MISNKTITIKESTDDMLSIELSGKSLFYGNVWDFNRNASTFKELFESLGHKVIIEELPSNEEESDDEE